MECLQSLTPWPPAMHDPPPTPHSHTHTHTQLHHFISKLLLYTCTKHVAQQTVDSGYSKSVLSFGHLTGLMETPLVVHHISHLLEIGSFPWGGGDVLDGFLGILWIKLVIKVRHLDCVRQQKIMWSCVHLNTWALFNFTKENQPLFFFQTRSSIWQVEVRFFQFLIWSGFWLLQGKDLTSKVNFSFNILFRQSFLETTENTKKILFSDGKCITSNFRHWFELLLGVFLFLLSVLLTAWLEEQIHKSSFLQSVEPEPNRPFRPPDVTQTRVSHPSTCLKTSSPSQHMNLLWLSKSCSLVLKCCVYASMLHIGHINAALSCINKQLFSHPHPVGWLVAGET